MKLLHSQRRRAFLLFLLMTLLFHITPVNMQAKSSAFTIKDGVLVSYSGKSTTA